MYASTAPRLADRRRRPIVGNVTGDGYLLRSTESLDDLGRCRHVVSIKRYSTFSRSILKGFEHGLDIVV